MDAGQVGGRLAGGQGAGGVRACAPMPGATRGAAGRSAAGRPTHLHPCVVPTFTLPGGCDKTVKMWSLATNQSQVVAKHDAPVRDCFFVQQLNMLVTGSWDRTLRYWDLRQPNPVHVQQVPERVYSMDVKGALMVVALANRRIQACPAGGRGWVCVEFGRAGVDGLGGRGGDPLAWVPGQGRLCLVCAPAARPRPTARALHPAKPFHSYPSKPHLPPKTLQVFNLSNPQAPYKDIESPLKFQTRCVSAFPDQTGYLVGSIEGRVAVQHVEDALATKNFTFKCHRDGADIYAVNSISFHPQFGTFVTTGADGAYNFWDKDSKQRLKAMQKCDQSIPCGAFNRDGSVYAYAVSYDWSHGYAGHNPATAKNHILLHAPQESEVKNRARPKR